MSKKLQSIRGMHDILPDDTATWQYLEMHIFNLMESYAYSEIRLPIVEYTELFARSIGDVTDIVEKEMYTFDDRNGDSLSLRPEGTASCVRAGLEHGLLHNQVQRLWYLGPMFRHERPQKGRYRQFYQLGVEAFGMQGPGIDTELILMVARLWKVLGLKGIELEINTLGTSEERQAFRKVLVNYFEQNASRLDEDSQRRLHSNPLRILDSKNPQMIDVVEGAPQLWDYLGEGSKRHFSGLQDYLNEAGIQFRINPRLVRGLDYYCQTVFEWVTDELGAQGTVCAGGRYDGLVDQLGGRSSGAVGFAMGLERVISLMQSQFSEGLESGPDIYIISADEGSALATMCLAESIRDDLPKLSIMCHCGSASLKSQFKQADRSGAEYALILGAKELRQGEVSVKALRQENDQQSMSRAALIEFLINTFNYE